MNFIIKVNIFQISPSTSSSKRKSGYTYSLEKNIHFQETQIY